MQNLVEKNNNRFIEAKGKFCLFTFICMSVIQSFLSSIGITGIFRTGIMGILVFVPVIYYFAKNTKSFPFDYFYLLFSIIIVYEITKFAHPDYMTKIKTEMWLNVVSLYRGIIGYLFIRLIPKKEDFKTPLLASAYVLFLAYFIESLTAIRNGYWIAVVDGVKVHQSYSMVFGYNMLLPTTIFAYYGLREKKIYNIILAIIGGGEILMMGSRAASLCLMVFIILYYLFIYLKNCTKQKKALAVSIFIVISSAFMLSYKSIILALSSLFQSIGFSSRTMVKLLEGTLADDNNRQVIWDKAKLLINEHWLFGNGFLSDRYFFEQYSHNIFIEILLEFGVIFGGILIVYIVYHIIKMFLKCKDEEWLGLFLIFFTCCFVRLIVSYSVWIDTNFWMMVGIWISYRKYEKEALLDDKNSV